MACDFTCNSSEEWVGNGTQVDFEFAFPYIVQDDVVVKLFDESTGRWETVASTEYSFLNAQTIRFNAPPQSGVRISISRCTDIDPLIAEFQPGSAIRARDLNDNFQQLQFAIEDGQCQDAYLDSNKWDKQKGETLYTEDEFICDDARVATAGAICQKIQEDIDDRIVTNPDEICPGDETHIPSTEATCQFVTDKIDEDFLLRKVDRAMQVTGIAESFIDAEHFFTTDGSVARHDMYQQEDKPVEPPHEQPGKQWHDTATLDHYIWDANAGAWVDMRNAGPPGVPGPYGPPGKVLISDSPPTLYPSIEGQDPRPLASGDLWWDSLNVMLYVYYQDIASQQWVAVSKTGPQGEKGDPGDQGIGAFTFEEPLVDDGTGFVTFDLNTIPRTT